MPYRAKRVSARQTVPPCLNNLAVRRKVWFERDGAFVIGEGGFELLHSVRVTGSLTAAARIIGWSYRHAWGYLRRAENRLGERLTICKAGKGRNRGMTVTVAADGLIQMGRDLGWVPQGRHANPDG